MFLVEATVVFGYLYRKAGSVKRKAITLGFELSQCVENKVAYAGFLLLKACLS